MMKAEMLLEERDAILNIARGYIDMVKPARPNHGLYTFVDGQEAYFIRSDGASSVQLTRTLRCLNLFLLASE